jgi:hypothetical protein
LLSPGWADFFWLFQRHRAKPAQSGWKFEHQLRSGQFYLVPIQHFWHWHIPCLGWLTARGQHACVVRDKAKLTNQPQEETSMKIKNLLTACGITAALMVSAGSIYAQNGNGGGGNGGGGFGGGGGGGGGFRNMTPAQMQQRMLDRYRQDLNFTNDADWSAVQPLVQKVLDARMAVGLGGRGFGRGGRGGGQGGGGGGNNPFNQPNPDRDALQQAIDDNAPSAQVQALLTRYQATQKAKQATLAAAQDDLRKVLTVQQEASATLSGLLD